jgi:hypothetical protein
VLVIQILAHNNKLVLYNKGNNYTEIDMSDSGFACPKCDLVFTTAEDVARHLKNEHVDGSQTERLDL